MERKHNKNVLINIKLILKISKKFLKLFTNFNLFATDKDQLK